MRTSSFFAELRRRNVLRAGAFYAAAGWLLVQIATQVFPFFDIPNWAVRLIVIAVVVGFPFALAFSWFYELTPEGIKRESEIDPAESITYHTGKKLDRWIIAALCLAVVVLLANSFVLRRDEAPAVTEKSIAVLPFENLSEEKSNAYFADGIQDEILTRLAKIGALKVISRTSTRQYAAKPGNLGEIARQLGVANILEGSVQKAGDAVHITVQLIKAATDEHLWAESYDRKLDNVFGVEGEVAQAIASELEVKLSGGEQAAIARRPTSHPDAYDAYLRGLAFESRGLTSALDVPREAASRFAESVRLDPGFALAWAHLAIVRSYMYANLVDRTPTALAEMKQAADTALRLQPELGEAHLALGYYRYRGLRDFDGALRDFEQARERLPNSADVLAAIGYIERRQGRWQDSVAHLEQATRLTPRDLTVFVELATNYAALREFATARATLDRALAIAPGASNLIAAKAGVWLREGDLDEAGKLLGALSPRPEDEETLMVQVCGFEYRRDFAAAIGALNAALAQPEPPLGANRAFYLISLATAQLWSGDADAARANFTQAANLAEAYGKTAADDPHVAQVLAVAYAGLGDKARALREAQHAIDVNAGDAVVKPNMETTQAQIQAYFGDADAAIATLPHLLAVPNGLTVADLRFNPLWDPLRKDPRFQKLIAGGTTAKR
ncbi:hypothetical protein [Dokdonella soli]|uniref:Tetratricopeptide repeat protein n=1 Tax=Dokdonella soli TaxID=529810 RepID=A0ABN1IEA1_9GAMM